MSSSPADQVSTPTPIFGGGGIGGTEKSFTFTWTDASKTSELLSALQELGIKELDSAASYPPSNPWNTETLLGESKATEKGFVIDSKVAAHIENPHLTDELIAASIDKTLQLLGAKKIRTLHAHRPDTKTPLEEQAAAFDKQYRLGKFERLGICNHSAEQMRELFAICDAKGYVKPTVYQGHYNALVRGDEKELIPLLRQHGCVYNAYSPLAGGFLTGKVTFAQDTTQNQTPSSDTPADPLDRTRWRGASAMSYYPNLFDTPSMHDAIRALKRACDKTSPPISLQEASLRWLMHHSAMRAGDGIILGAKTIEQLVGNVECCRRGPLDGDEGLREVRACVEGLWGMVQGGMKSVMF